MTYEHKKWCPLLSTTVGKTVKENEGKKGMERDLPTGRKIVATITTWCAIPTFYGYTREHKQV